MNNLDLASGQDEPWKIAIDVAGSAAVDESNATKSHWSEYAEFCSGKENATPGYERTYVPYGVEEAGGIYSPG